MSTLVACPFCREPTDGDEAGLCPHCGLSLAPVARLAAPFGAADDEDERVPPHMERLGWGYTGRGRGALIALSLVGLALFFTPWAHETAPEARVLTGLGFAQALGWMWAPAVAWFVMIPLVVTRRSVHEMRGARVAAAFLVGVVLTTVAVRLYFAPVSTALRPARFEWGYGLYATGLVALAALAAAVRLGGRLDDLPTRQRRRGDETLH